MAIQCRLNPKNNKKKQYAFRVYYKDLFGKRIQKHGAWRNTQKEAAHDEAMFKSEMFNDNNFNTKLKDIALDWIQYSQSRNTVKTYHEKKYIVDTFILPVFGKIKANDITATMIKTWLHSDLLKFKTKEYKSGNKKILYTVDYQNKVFGMLSTILKHGIKFHGLKYNVCEQVDRLKKPFSQRKEMVVYDIDEFKKFYNSLDCNNTYKTFYRLLFFTGLRFSEAQGLTWNDLKGNRLNISKQWNERIKEFVELKTQSSKRVVDLDAKTLSQILELKKEYEKYECFKAEWFIFGGTSPIPKKTVDNIKNRTINDNCLRYLRIHDFRHSHASMLIDNGGENVITAVSKRLGHADVSMTLKRYTHLMKKSQEGLLKILDEIE